MLRDKRQMERRVFYTKKMRDNFLYLFDEKKVITA